MKFNKENSGMFKKMMADLESAGAWIKEVGSTFSFGAIDGSYDLLTESVTFYLNSRLVRVVFLDGGLKCGVEVYDYRDFVEVSTMLIDYTEEGSVEEATDRLLNEIKVPIGVMKLLPLYEVERS